MKNSRDEIMEKFAGMMSGESEWSPEEEKSSGESEWGQEPEVDPAGIDIDEGSPSLSDEELLKMIEKDPIHVVTNLMIQRKPEYQRLEIIHPLLKGTIEWMTEAKMETQEGQLLYDETKFMLELMEAEVDKKDVDTYEDAADLDAFKRDQETQEEDGGLKIVDWSKSDERHTL